MKKEDQIKQPRLSKHEKRLKEFHEKMEYENITSNYSRARSISVGTAFGGTTEIMVRGDGGRHLWLNMQPVEVIELIHQLASNIGCHMAIKPREDFSSWRDWKVSDQERLHYNGWAPFVNDMAPFNQLGANMQKFEEEKQHAREILELKQSPEEESILQIKAESESLTDEEKLIFFKSKADELSKKKDGSNNLNVDENNNVLNETFLKNERLFVLGGKGGQGKVEESNIIKFLNDEINEINKKQNDETLAAEKTINKRKSKRSSTST